MRLWALLVLVSVVSAATNTTGFFDALFSGILSKDPSQRDNGFRRLLGAVLPDRCQGLIDASQTSSVPSDGCLDSMLSGLRAKNGSLLETLSGTVARSRDQLKDELTRSLKAMLPDICSEARLPIDVSGRPSSVGRPAMRGGANVSSMLDQIFQSFPQVVQPPAQSVASRLMSAGEAQPVEGRLFVDGTWRNLQCQLVDPVTRHASATPDLPVIARLIQSQLVPIREVLPRSEAASPVVGSTRPTPPASRGLKPAARPDSTTAPGLGVGGRFEEGDFTVRGSTSSVPPLALAFLLSYTLSLL